MLQWQTEPNTKKVLRQLQSSPKVVVTPISPDKRNLKDHSVPDLENIGNYVECASSEDIYQSENAPEKENASNSTSDELEYELSRMFENEKSEEVNFVSAPKTPKQSTGRVRKNRKDNFKDLLIQLFGSTLDDVNEKSSSKPKKVNCRRRSLPVSIELEILKPLAVNTKRTDAPKGLKHARAVKVDYTSVNDLVIPSVHLQTPGTVMCEELKMAAVTNAPSLKTSENVKNSGQVIDLTGDDFRTTTSRTLEFNGIRIDVPHFKAEANCTSEQANVASMPSLSPVRAQTVIRKTAEETIPIKRMEESVDKLQHVASERLKSMQQQQHDSLKRKLEDHIQVETLKKQTTSNILYGSGQVQAKQPRIQQPQTNRANSLTFRLVQQAPSQNSQRTVHLSRAQPSKIQPAPQPPPPSYQFHVPQQSQPILPQLSRLVQPEFRQVTNPSLADKILPHFLRFLKWTNLAYKFYEDSAPCLTALEIRDDPIQIRNFMNTAVQHFGKKLIQDLSVLNVENFNLGHVLHFMSLKISDQHGHMTVLRICTYLYSLIGYCEQYCQTPFTKKFFGHVKLANEKMEARKAREVPKFTPVQLARLEMQIQCFKAIEVWMRLHLVNVTTGETAQSSRRNPSVVLKPTSEISSNLRNMQRTVSVPETAQVPRTVTAPVETPPAVHRSKSVPENVAPTPAPVQNNVAPAQQFTAPANGLGTALPLCNKQEPVPATVKLETKEKHCDNVIDLTWIDDANDDDILEVIECKPFPFKTEAAESGAREVVSPVDSGLGSPGAQSEDDYKCLCGNRAAFICACNNAMYCSEACQQQDWPDHQNLCHKSSLNSK